VDVRDTIPPTSNDTFLCFPIGAPNNTMIIPDATKPGGLFEAADSCSAVSITILSCSSNQDAQLGLFSSNGFTEHCFLDTATDSMVIRGEFDRTDLKGRKFTIRARVSDACGHSVDVKAEIDLRVQLRPKACPPQ
jgi:hypothetical protein